jgi:hypothetical protein
VLVVFSDFLSIVSTSVLITSSSRQFQSVRATEFWRHGRSQSG